MLLTVNGREVDVTSSADTPLLWVVRDELKLSGSKFGCGMGYCGACTMHIDGSPVRSCITPVKAAQGRAVTTIEGLGTREEPHALQSAWIEHDVPQCGYCQSGQLMSAAALLATNPQPTDEEINQAMSGNLCRCGTYPNIRKAIHAAAGSSLAAVGVWEPNV